jgi:hypothetical protein
MEREGSSSWSQQPTKGQLTLIYIPEEYSQLDPKPLKNQTLSSLCRLGLRLASVRSLQVIQPKSVRISHLVAGQHMARRTNYGVLSFNIWNRRYSPRKINPFHESCRSCTNTITHYIQAYISY